jgi:hypothetical protein
MLLGYRWRRKEVVLSKRSELSGLGGGIYQPNHISSFY